MIRKKIEEKIEVKYEDILIDYLGMLGLKNINALLKNNNKTPAKI
jgi:hypothetical protein